MRAAATDFDERMQEIEGYVSFLRKLGKDGAELRYQTESGEAVVEPISPEILKTLKASTFLLLYNLVEASIRGAVQRIFDALEQERTSYDDIRDELRKVVIRNVRRSALSEDAKGKLHSTNSIARSLITETFEVEDLFTGNIDGKKIRLIAEEYGFSSRCSHKEARDGADLLQVKRVRNDLGHGVRTFGDVGKDLAVSDVEEVQRRVLVYLTDILANVQAYLDGREYLRGREHMPEEGGDVPN